MKRRTAIKILSAGATGFAIVGIPKLSVASTPKGIRLSQILHIAKDEFVKHQLSLGLGKWVNNDMAFAEEDGKVIRFQTMKRLSDVPSKSEGKFIYYRNHRLDAKKIEFPITWTRDEEFAAGLKGENVAISLAVNLLKNSVDVHDFLLSEQLGTGKLIVLEPRYVLSPVIDHGSFFTCNMSCTYANV
jgi:hypothetical protein